MLGIYSSGIWRIPFLDNLLPGNRVKLSTRAPIPEGVTAVAVWGYRPSAQKPVELATEAGLPVIRLEDGFIRSLGLGVEGAPPLSMVIDNQGIYYDASTPSELEALIKDSAGNACHHQQARDLMTAIVDSDLSKYNKAPPFSPPATMAPCVLVVDQTFGDVSVSKGNADADAFRRMLDTACAENPDAEVLVKVHPDVLCGKKAGYFAGLKNNAQVRLFAEDVSPQSLLRHVKHVYVVTSQYGFEALLAGKPVTCFGQPWYAGWGLTDDRHPQAATLAARRGNATLVELFIAAYLRYSHYRHPVTGSASTLGSVVAWLSQQRQHRLTRTGTLWAPGLSLWKSAILKPYLQTSDNRVRFASQCPTATALIAWGTRGEVRWQQQAKQQGLPLWRMEDGFIRSSGLGSDLLAPLSLVLDKTGIYYDASRPSDLESLLNHSQLTTEQHQRAQALWQKLIASKLSKYNLGASWELPLSAAGKRTLLVTGQVENDASIARGTATIRTNLTLLHTVRERYPDAFIIYKPHPDVLVGNRPGHISDEEMHHLADCIALDADIIECIQQVDEVHTMTSLSGFEALMHGKKVFCYGMPFYAGWGLTTDEYCCERRQRRLTISDLLYQTLISYPTYIHPESKQCISPEMAMDWLLAQKRKSLATKRGSGQYLQRQGRKLQMLLKAMKN
ncbi:capsular polysaccharide biosynthesis protein [Escherichia coli]|nr:capsular polysaccharide biosynthesis protein [Escherichia coli]